MSRLRKAVLAATLVAIPVVTPVLAAVPASAELVAVPDTSGSIDETAGFRDIYRDCRDFGGGRISCAILAWKNRNIG